MHVCTIVLGLCICPVFTELLFSVFLEDLKFDDGSKYVLFIAVVSFSKKLSSLSKTSMGSGTKYLKAQLLYSFP